MATSSSCSTSVITDSSSSSSQGNNSFPKLCNAAPALCQPGTSCSHQQHQKKDQCTWAGVAEKARSLLCGAHTDQHTMSMQAFLKKPPSCLCYYTASTVTGGSTQPQPVEAGAGCGTNHCLSFRTKTPKPGLPDS